MDLLVLEWNVSELVVVASELSGAMRIEILPSPSRRELAFGQNKR